jgi:glycosyltransferase involved in cell wall biosynthesis
MNILFILHNAIDSNSGYHIQGIAKELTLLGHDCIVTAPHGRLEGENFRIIHYTNLFELIAKGSLFRDRRQADIVHVWTPRQVVKYIYERLACYCTPTLVIHLEDNEESIARSFLGDEAYNAAISASSEDHYPRHLTHPNSLTSFLGKAMGITVLVDKLRDFVPQGITSATISPAADERIFNHEVQTIGVRAKFKIPDNKVIIVYNGNTNPATEPEIRELYRAVHLLNESGIPAVLVRSGEHKTFSDSEFRSYESRYSINLGFLEDRYEIGKLLALADVLVQPGQDNSFNKYRFPSKIPEFFAVGRPVVLPRVNIGIKTRHLTDAYVLDKADATAIRDAVKAIIEDPDLAKSLSKGARAFYEANFSWEKTARQIEEFYSEIVLKDLVESKRDNNRIRLKDLTRNNSKKTNLYLLILRVKLIEIWNIIYTFQKDIINFPRRIIKHFKGKDKRLVIQPKLTTLAGYNNKMYAEVHDLDVATAIVNFVDSGFPRGEWFLPSITPHCKTGLVPEAAKVAIQWHAYYPEMVEGVVKVLERARMKPDLLITVTSQEAAERVASTLAGKKVGKSRIKLIPNRGRDLGAFLTAFPEISTDYEFIGHLHTKKSLHNNDRSFVSNWYSFLIESIIGGTHPMMDIILSNMAANPRLGLVFPNDPHHHGWGRNYYIATEYAQKLNIPLPLQDYLAFPAGSMFWARSAALEALFNQSLQWKDYPLEPLPDDGTILHALERLLPLVAIKAGYEIATSHVDAPFRSLFDTNSKISMRIS